VWGAATASYQVEGAAAEDGRGPSIWDRFVRVPGAVAGGDTGAVACDHYHRWREDVGWMKRLGFDAYQFSIAWSRVMPGGRGRVEPRGLDFYGRLVDGLLEAGITPFATLHHFDLPQALQDDGGGWLRREVGRDFQAYVDVVTRALGDRVKRWATFNEPWELAWQGYHTGEDAPGLRLGVDAALRAGHHVLLAHGLAVQAIRANVPGAEAGIVLHLNPVEPATPAAADAEAARRWEGCQNRWFLDPLFRGSYPADMLELFGPLSPGIEPGDPALIGQPLDFLGINLYRRSVVAAGADLPPVDMRRVNPPGAYSTMGWEVWPRGLHDILLWVHRYCAPPRIYVTENGFASDDAVGPDGRCRDPARVEYVRAHLAEALRARAEGVPLRGYFVWSTLDNFEWAYGYRRRFGVIHVDFATQRRTVKDSGRLLQRIAGEPRGECPTPTC